MTTSALYFLTVHPFSGLALSRPANSRRHSVTTELVEDLLTPPFPSTASNYGAPGFHAKTTPKDICSVVLALFLVHQEWSEFVVYASTVTKNLLFSWNARCGTYNLVEYGIRVSRRVQSVYIVAQRSVAAIGATYRTHTRMKFGGSALTSPTTSHPHIALQPIRHVPLHNCLFHVRRRIS